VRAGQRPARLHVCALQFFAANGWQLLVRHSWQQAALKYGWLPQLTAAGQHRTHTQEVQLVVGVVRK
jgi:hypothetical protein